MGRTYIPKAQRNHQRGQYDLPSLLTAPILLFFLCVFRGESLSGKSSLVNPLSLDINRAPHHCSLGCNAREAQLGWKRSQSLEGAVLNSPIYLDNHATTRT